MDDAVRELTSAVAAGDAAAFERLYRRWFGEVLGYVRRATGRDESFGLDVVQDVMMKVIRTMPVLECEDSLRAWLRRVALTTARDRLKAEARRVRRERVLGAAVAGDGVSTPRAAKMVERSEALAEVERLLAELDPVAAGLILGKHRFGWTLGKIAGAAGLKPGAVDGRLSRLVARWRAEVGGHDE